jgi:hypothetical protein
MLQIRQLRQGMVKWLASGTQMASGLEVKTKYSIDYSSLVFLLDLQSSSKNML